MTKIEQCLFKDISTHCVRSFEFVPHVRVARVNGYICQGAMGQDEVLPVSSSSSRFLLTKTGKATPFLSPYRIHMDAEIRKKIHHLNLPGQARELTSSCYHRFPLLSRDRTRRRLIESIEAARQKRGFAVLAFVIMPEHVHILVFPAMSSTGKLAALPVAPTDRTLALSFYCSPGSKE